MLKSQPFKKPVVLKNTNCPFCGDDVFLDWTKEHIIGRNFVPKGTLNKEWNLILRACRECNNRKSDLEDDLSSISMLPKLGSSHVEEGALKESSQRKLKSKSRKTGKPVGLSHETIEVRCEPMPGLAVNYSLISPPQAEPSRIYELCRLQLAGFFFFQTYNENTFRGGFWLEGFYPVSSVTNTDWGNDTQVSFSNIVQDWETRFYLSTANNFYRVIIRRDPSGTCWAWAVEWNRNYRTVGFFGNHEIAQATFDEVVFPIGTTVSKNQGGIVTIRKEVRIEEDEDMLFEPRDI